ncbi:MAG: hypothetical protein F2667_04045 [Actinobacteria bacterium]|uniref:Unannotated protein n=1 Tax=freshwater metagenome TaxID=449393 RepID=A0A6J6PGS2_9ZZZZ|nr:hypothetical protein [Actinomycetota bacterium]
MADDDTTPDGPSIAPPRLRFRRRSTRPAVEATPDPAPEQPTVVLPAAPDAEATAARSASPLFVDEVLQELPQERVARRGVPVRLAVGSAGLLAGAGTVGLTAASLRLCEVVRGTSSCGGPGFLLLVGIMAAMVLLGGGVLRLLRVADPVSISFLGIGLTCVIALLFLVDDLLDPQMIVVIPAVAVLSFLAAHWVTSALVDPTDT